MSLRCCARCAIGLSLLLCTFAAIVGAFLVAVLDPMGSAIVALGAITVAAVLTRAWRADFAAFQFFALAFSVLALGLYALYVLFGVPWTVLLWVGYGIAVLPVLLIGLAPSDPYDDDDD